mgnify:CR=1 FL=1
MRQEEYWSYRRRGKEYKRGEECRERDRSFLRGWGKNRARRGIVLNYCLVEMICEATELTKIAPSMHFFLNVMHTFNWWGKTRGGGGRAWKKWGKEIWEWRDWGRIDNQRRVCVRGYESWWEEFVLFHEPCQLTSDHVRTSPEKNIAFGKRIVLCFVWHGQ